MTRLSDFREGSHLNSVWLEGTLTSDPVEIRDDRGLSCRFVVVSPWASDPPSEFFIEADDSAFGMDRTRVRTGRRVRIIGRLRQRRRRREEPEVSVVSELVELVGEAGPER